MNSIEHKALRRPFRLLVFALKFLRALIAANMQMATIILFRRNSALSPSFVHYPIAGLSDWELLLLTHAITLTPGTTSVEISDDRSTLLVHALDGHDATAVIASIKNDLEAPLLAWTR